MDSWPNANGGQLYPHNDHNWPNSTCGLCGAVQQAAGIGLEPTLGEWVENIVAVMREVRRVLRDDGTCWLNLGDAYAGSGKGHSNDVNPGISKSYSRCGDTRLAVKDDLPPKNLMGQPWRVAFALQDDGANVPALRTVERIIDEFHDAFDDAEIRPRHWLSLNDWRRNMQRLRVIRGYCGAPSSGTSSTPCRSQRGTGLPAPTR